MFGEMKTTALLAKGNLLDPTVLPASQALEMATLNGARALGIENETGSLEIGKSADIIAIDFDSYLVEPLYNVISQLVYTANRLQVSDVWIAGRQVLANSELTTLDVNAARDQLQFWAAKIKALRS
jgi:5-methylthioadenosine/S-adenosylhomocysteine deaminase